MSAREEARGSERISNDLWSYTRHARDVGLRSRYVTAFRREGESRARATLGSRARAGTHIAQGIINECISIRQFFHVALGNARTAGGRAGYIARSIKMSPAWQLPRSRRRFDPKAFFPATVEAAPVWKSPWSAPPPYQGRETRDAEVEFRGIPGLADGGLVKSHSRRQILWFLSRRKVNGYSYHFIFFSRQLLSRHSALKSETHECDFCHVSQGIREEK